MSPVAAAAHGVGTVTGSRQAHAPHPRQTQAPSSRLQLPAALQHSYRQISQARSRASAAAARPIAFASVEAPVPSQLKVRAWTMIRVRHIVGPVDARIPGVFGLREVKSARRRASDANCSMLL